MTKDLTGVAAAVVQTVHGTLLRVALQVTRDDYEVRQVQNASHLLSFATATDQRRQRN